MSCAAIEIVSLPDRKVQSTRRGQANRRVQSDRTVRSRTVARPAASAGSTPLRLTTRGRVMLGMLAGLVVAGSLLGAQQSAQAGAPEAPVPVVRHIVERGDTLWQLAVSVADPGEDVRDVVAELQALNGLPGQDVRVGQELLLPAG